MSDGLLPVYARANQLEEVAYHLIAVPIGAKAGQDIEYVQHILPRGFNGVVNGIEKCFDACLGVYHNESRACIGSEQGWMLAEAKIDQLALLPHGRCSKWRNEGFA